MMFYAAFWRDHNRLIPYRPECWQRFMVTRPPLPHQLDPYPPEERWWRSMPEESWWDKLWN